MKTEFVTAEMPKGPTAVALGVFDGVHRGHRAVLKEAARIDYLEPWVFTFSERSLPTGKRGALRLEPGDIKYGLMKKCGIAHVYAPDFDEVKELSGEEFVKKILVDHLRCRKVVCGTDFRFGKNAACGVGDLRTLCEQYGMECSVIEKLYDDGEAISSTRIREACENGDMKTVRRLCGYPFCVRKEVVPGKHLGRQFGLPTINQGFDKGYIIPKFGVYVSAAFVDGKLYPAVTNVGVKPTVSEENVPVMETNIIGLFGDLYGKTVTVFLLEFVREEMVFEDRETLFERIALDRKNAEKGAKLWIEGSGAETLRLLGIENEKR